MPPTVRDVVAIADLGLVVRAMPPDGLDREVRWVAVSELEDPGRWLEGGELLLTTGLRLPDDRRASDRYVGGLVAAGVTALGLAVGISHDEMPGVLVRAADRAGLPLLEVPRPTPFIAVSKAVSRLLAAEEYAETGRGLAAQRELIRAALGADDGGAEAVVARLARHVDGFALHLDPSGQVVHARPPAAADQATELQEEISRLQPRGLLASAVVSDLDRHVVVQPLGLRGRARGFLAVGSRRPLSPSDQAVVSLAVSLLSLALGRDDAQGGAEQDLRTMALRLLVTGRPGRLPVESLGWADLLAGAVRVVAADPAADPVPVVARLADRRGGAAAAAGVLAGRPELVVAVVPAADVGGVLGDLVGGTAPVAAAAGASDPVDGPEPGVLGGALDQALRALAAARGRSDGAARALTHAELPGTPLDTLLDPAATRAWAAGVLQPLASAADAADLLATLRAWLARHGQVDATATDLGVHRHTVRHRLRRAESALGRSLDDPDVRADLWVALSHRDGPRR